MEELNCKGMRCPMPIVETAKKMTRLESGEQLRVLADDGGFPADIRAWCAATGNLLVDLNNDEKEHTATVQKR